MDDQNTNQVPQAEIILQSSLQDKEHEWEALDDASLTDNLITYYETLGELTKRIDEAMRHNVGNDATGVVDYDNAGDGDALNPAQGQSAGRKEDGLGVEGVDFYEGSLDDVDPREWQVPQHCIPIHTNVTTYDWTDLSKACQFDVIMMDPPWQLATANPTRGVALGYSQLTDRDIQNLPIPKLQSNGLLFIWVINAKYQFTLDLFEQWGYTLVDEIVWVKMTVNRRLAKSHGFYLQHAKEVCLVGRRGGDIAGLKQGVGSDIIYSERRGQSQKPEEIYELIEKLVPNGKYLEIFGRKNNLRNFWVTVGNEVTGQGLPERGD
jgi:mRNA m6A methyltransferase catalytic subunit